ncbi:MULTISPECIES: cupin domain-containing protein [unclassified Streptomyces]|uniref:cupin domain-containing protein n=1 Tax=unclassified Streptomyces TaxID=2593676 RepID=UPI002DDA107D|nr:cupin domain-containing protein [Streptomyces sp. NBC_01750]WSB01415.1 cupin domain-containing protein [Streptomyces sp. NBC_01794]WSD34237.1 cupin domain-containing protein [Streptomyces sp. NBC_01750]
MNTHHNGPARPHETHLSAGEITNLPAMGEELLADARSANSGSSGRTARTVVALPGLRVTLIALAAGSELAEHEAPDAATLTCLTGRVTLRATDRTWRLGQGDIVAIPDQRHSLTAETDATVLLTVRLA